jgi:hypothetical protein
MGEKRKAYRVLVRKLEGKRTLGRSRSRWVDNTKIDFTEKECGGMICICLAQNRD